MNVKSASVNPIDFLAHQCANKWLISSSPKTIGRHYADVIVRRVQTVSERWHIGNEVNGIFKHLIGERGTFTDYLI